MALIAAYGKIDNLRRCRVVINSLASWPVPVKLVVSFGSLHDCSTVFAHFNNKNYAGEHKLSMNRASFRRNTIRSRNFEYSITLKIIPLWSRSL